MKRLLLKDPGVLVQVVEFDLQIEYTKIIMSKYSRKIYQRKNLSETLRWKDLYYVEKNRGIDGIKGHGNGRNER